MQVNSEDSIKEMIRSREIRENILKYINYENNDNFLNKKVPKSLFKYLKFDEKAIECLRDNKEYNLEASNIDYILELDSSIEISKKTLDEIIDRLRDRQDKYKIVSLHEVEDSIFMWKGYCENHTGICVEYDFSSYNECLEQIFPVKYLDKPIDIIGETSEGVLKDVIKLITKSQVYSYEKEWRIIDYAYYEELLPIKTYNMPKIKSITLGKNFLLPILKDFSLGKEEKLDLLEKLIEFVCSKNIPLFYSNRKMGTYSLNKIRLNIGTLNRILKLKKDSIYNLIKYINKLRIINDEEKLKYIFIDSDIDENIGWIFASNNTHSISRVCNYIKLLFETYNCKFSTYITDSKHIKIERFVRENNCKYNYCISDELLLIEEIHNHLEKFNIKY